MSFVSHSRGLFLSPLADKSFWQLGLFLVLAQLLFSTINLSGLKNHIQEEQVNRLNLQVDRFLKRSELHRGGLGSILREQRPEKLSGIDFIRLTRGDDHLVLSGEGSLPVDFQTLVRLEDDFHGNWVSLTPPYAKGRWVVINRRLGDGIRLLAGINGQNGQLLYRKLWTSAVNTSLILLPLSIILVYVLTFFRRLRLKNRIDELGETLSKKNDRSAQRTPKDELSPLHDRLVELASQNRLLVETMQESLDNVAHDLRTPMARLRSVAEYGLQTQRTESEYQQLLSDCLEESERVLSILKIMMDTAEAEAGTITLDFETIDIGRSLTEILGLYEYVAEEKNITLSSNLQQNLLIRGDRTRMGQAWANLLDNSIKYTAEHGMVRIESELRDQWIITRFIDSGIGISESEQQRIWQRLYRGDRSRSQPGLGLGLSYVRPIIEAHGGNISVTSSLDQGAIFTVELPVYREG
ncbi:MAG: HAMP domain-containing sensor histidine kinase [Thermodesulfobacteriota bacterium]